MRKREAIILLGSIAALPFFSLASIEPIAAQIGSVSVAIEPVSKEVLVGEEFSLSITVTPAAGQLVDGVQVFLDYQPEFLELIDVAPGTALPLALWDPPYFDNTTGQIGYAAGTFSNFPTSGFTLAILHLKALKATSETSLSFIFDYEAGRMTKATWKGDNFVIEPVDGKVMIGVDTVAPVIANWAPTGTAATVRPTISAEYSDALSGIEPTSVALTLDGTDVTAQSAVTATEMSYTPTGALAEGPHIVELGVSDMTGNQATKEWSFTVSTPLPPPPEEVEQLPPEEAADVLEELQPDEVAKVVENVSTEHVGDILEEMSAEVAGEVMEEMSTEKLTETVPEMTEESLTERLPELSAEKLYEVPPEVLFEALPNAPTEQLVGEEPPVPPPDLEAPTVFETPTGTRYLVIRTKAGEWAIIVGTPEPLTKIMVKAKQDLANIETLVEILEAKPVEIVAELPPQQLVNTYVRITVQNIPPEDIIAGHLAFQIEKDWMQANQIHKWSVVLYRYDEQLKLWIALPTKRVDEDESYVYYTAVTQKFSAFAIAGSGTVPTIGFEASNITISPDDVAIGEEVTIDADITNLSTEEGTYVITLWINNTVEEVKEITLAANGTETVSFTVVPEEEGTYEVRIDRLTGSFTVVPPPAPRPKPEPTPMWLYAVAVVGGLIALSAAVSVVAWLRRRSVGVR